MLKSKITGRQYVNILILTCLLSLLSASQGYCEQAQQASASITPTTSVAGSLEDFVYTVTIVEGGTLDELHIYNAFEDILILTECKIGEYYYSLIHREDSQSLVHDSASVNWTVEYDTLIVFTGESLVSDSIILYFSAATPETAGNSYVFSGNYDDVSTPGSTPIALTPEPPEALTVTVTHASEYIICRLPIVWENL